jgi:diguanylate cyclase (GGDEF)-like protein
MPQSVLMVDDSIPLHAVVRAHLEPGDLRLYSAYDGESALPMAMKIRPDLILLDVGLPNGDGFEVGRALKAHPATALVPLVFLTADSFLSSKEKGLQLGAVDYITKPFDPNDLQARVRLALPPQQVDQVSPIVDVVTGMWNQARLSAHLPARLWLSKHSGQPLACIVGDIDGLSAFNAKHGDALTSALLRGVAEIFRSRCREKDTIFRVNSGRLVILMHGMDSEMASYVADRLRIDVQRRMRSFAGIETNITCSFGVADTAGASDSTIVDRANAAVDWAVKHRRINWVSIALRKARRRLKGK